MAHKIHKFKDHPFPHQHFTLRGRVHQNRSALNPLGNLPSKNSIHSLLGSALHINFMQ